MKQLSERIFYVGVNDDDKVLFEGLWPIPVGVSYNSYVVVDEKSIKIPAERFMISDAVIESLFEV